MRWFKHMSTAHTDARLRKLIRAHGIAGYGLYFYCLELICKDVDESRLTFVLEDDSELISDAVKMPREQVEAAMRTMVELNLFSQDNGRIQCMKMLNHMDSSMFKHGEKREKFQRIKDEYTNGTCTAPVPYLGDSTAQHSTAQGEQVPRRRFTPPTLQEVEARIAEMGYRHVVADVFWNHYEANGWKVGKNKMADWHKALGGWEARAKAETKTSSHFGERAL